MQEMLMKQKERVVEISDVRDKVVFITGGSLGIGRETCFIFAREGWSVVFSYFEHEKEAKEVEKKCMKLGAQEVMLLKMDVRKKDGILKGVKEIVKKFSKIDVLVNNAGVITWKKFLEQEDEEIENQLRTNLEGLIFVTKYCLPYVQEVVINVASVAGKNGYSELVPYCATKFGVRGFTQALSNEVSSGVKVYSVNPSMTSTRMTNFSGVDPLEVANVIFNASVGKFNVKSGGDIDVNDYL
jgi:3-oxoacyl-[acyl-carrier protein] reductase